MIRAGLRLLDGWRPDVVHAHDWLVTHPAITLAERADVPLVATMHATEAGRHAGWLSQSLNQQVHSVEWWLANRADKLITCSSAMRTEVSQLFELDPEPISVIHNGIEPRSWRVSPARVRAARERHAPQDGALLLFFGRLEYEKGTQDLLAALVKIRRTHPDTRLVVAGEGRQLQPLVEQARKLRIRRAVDFVGHLSDYDLVAALAAADATVLPSRYEPFGIVALEAAAAGAPLVASTAGGLGEVVVDGVTGVSFSPGDTDGIATAVRGVLDDPTAAAARAKTARSRLRTEFDWSTIAEATVAAYRQATVGGPRQLGRPKIATGNAFGPGES
jgi:glycogen(starch) synthase